MESFQLEKPSEDKRLYRLQAPDIRIAGTQNVIQIGPPKSVYSVKVFQFPILKMVPNGHPAKGADSVHCQLHGALAFDDIMLFVQDRFARIIAVS